MRYLKYTSVDAVSGLPVTLAPAPNGPVPPAVEGLSFGFALESEYPTTTPTLYGTCPDESAVDLPGVLEVVTEAQFQAAFAGELVARAAKRAQQNNRAYESATAALTADYPQLEKDTWPTQNAEAEAWVADPVGALTPWIDRAAAERGLDREEYIRRTLIKARQFVIMSSFLTGRRQKYEDEIKAGGSPELDFALTPSVLAELQQVAQTITINPAADMQEALA